MTILKIDSSANTTDSRSRELTAYLANKLSTSKGLTIVTRDLTKELNFISDAMLKVFYTPEDKLSEEDKAVLKPSDDFVDELIAADTIVFGVPMYNFGIPGTLKAYLDQICRLGKTFATNPEGFEGLLKNKKAYIVITTGGTPTGGDDDFITGYMTKVLSFVGITDIEFLALDKLDKEQAAQQKAKLINQIDAI